ncbi:TetR/AcrR family transcriptional regulator [Streptomyces sp. AJS327]|nr:TetR/AcrR family transcriptional regulator [Streptomyces sp. AJS327]
MDGAGGYARAHPGKGGYHHGDLRNALLEAATQLARDGGPEAVVLRAVARRVGVSPTAAYRHFSSQADLLDALKDRSQRRLAEAMERAAEGAPEALPPGERMRAIGRGYLRFALAEPGLYRVCFCRTRPDRGAGEECPDVERGQWMHRSFQILVEALDAIEASGCMRPGVREGAETAAWAAVHGLAMLLLDGQLTGLGERERDALVDRCVDAVVAGLVVP